MRSAIRSPVLLADIPAIPLAPQNQARLLRRSRLGASELSGRRRLRVHVRLALCSPTLPGLLAGKTLCGYVSGQLGNLLFSRFRLVLLTLFVAIRAKLEANISSHGIDF